LQQCDCFKIVEGGECAFKPSVGDVVGLQAAHSHSGAGGYVGVCGRSPVSLPDVVLGTTRGSQCSPIQVSDVHGSGVRRLSAQIGRVVAR